MLGLDRSNLEDFADHIGGRPEDGGRKVVYKHLNSLNKKIVCSIHIKGKQHEWDFILKDPITWENIKEISNDGILIYRVENIIPQWWINLGFPVRFWCFIQDWLGI